MGIYHRPEEGEVVGWWCWPVAVGAGKVATFRSFADESMYAPKKGATSREDGTAPRAQRSVRALVISWRDLCNI